MAAEIDEWERWANRERTLASFEEVIERAQKTGNLSREVKLVLRGRIDYAVERGDLTQVEARRLDALLGDDFTNQYRRVFEISAFGEPDDD